VVSRKRCKGGGIFNGGCVACRECGRGTIVSEGEGDGDLDDGVIGVVLSIDLSRICAGSGGCNDREFRREEEGVSPCVSRSVHATII
jgi:hypothetical protein